MSHYFIFPEPNQDWHVDIDGFLSSLKRDWPTVQMKWSTFPSDPILLEWDICSPNRERLQGALDQEQQHLYLDSSLEESVRFAVWYQSQYPQMKNFIFFDDGPNFDLYLYGLTEDQVLQKAQAGSSVWFPEKNHSGELPSFPLHI